jgi:hypothetical protein
MRAGRVLFVLASGAGALMTVASGCHTPTQVTLDISTSAQCGDLHGTALAVGITPTDTENKTYPLPGTSGASYNIVTSDCSGAKIGTLVVTPNDDSMEAAVVVVAAYSSPQIAVHDPASCVAPDFKDCIVARRRFTFIEHAKLTIPILLEPDCVNVPCNAVSTCHQGKCVDSTVETHDDGTTSNPGELPDGATDPDAIVVAPPDPPDGFVPGAPPPIPPPPNPPPVPPPNPPPPNDGGKDQDAGDAPSGAPICANDVLLCDGTAACGAGSVCCPTAVGAKPTCSVPAGCAQPPLCCGTSSTDCAGTSCGGTVHNGAPSVCSGGSTQPSCAGGTVANCMDGGACGANEVCCVNGASRTCEASGSCTVGSPLCCSGGNCASNTCNGATTTPGMCAPVTGGGTMCLGDGGIQCNGVNCTPGNVCCSGTPDHCTAKNACGTNEICCNGTECDTGKVCPGPPVAPATATCMTATGVPPDCNGVGGAIRCNGAECLGGQVCCTPAGGAGGTVPSCTTAGACTQPLCCNGIQTECNNTTLTQCTAGMMPNNCVAPAAGRSSCNPGLACGVAGTPCNPAGGSYCCQSTPDSCNATCGTYACCSNADCPPGKTCNLTSIEVGAGANPPAHLCQ